MVYVRTCVQVLGQCVKNHSVVLSLLMMCTSEHVACCVGVSKGKSAYILDVRTLPADVPHFPLMFRI